MKIAILGAGNAGCAVAADLSLRGHDVTLIKTSYTMHNENFKYIHDNNGNIRLNENGETKETKIKCVTRDCSEIENNEMVLVYTQTNYHEQLILKNKQFFKTGQIVVFNPGYLSTAYMLKHCLCNDITVVEAQSSFLDCRISDPGVVRVGFRNVRNPISVYPKRHTPLVSQKLNSMGFPLVYLSSVFEAALHNPNLIVHTVGAVMSIPRIEKTKGDYVMYHEVFTPSVWNILEQLDKEKMNVLEGLGLERVSYVEACKFRNSLDDRRDAKDVFFWYASMPTRAKGPTSVDSRYITEDIPQGLVLLESIASEYNFKTPVCTSLIEIANAALSRDFRAEGRNVQSLGYDNILKIINDKIG